MTEPEDREPKQPPKPSDEVWLPPRLRDKLGSADASGADDEDFLKKSPANVMANLIAGVIIVGILAGVWWMISASQAKEKAEQARIAEAARKQAVADSLVRVREDSLAKIQAQAVQDSIAAFLKTPAGRRALARAKAAEAAAASAAQKSTQPAASTSPGAGAGAAPAEPAEPPVPYGIEIGEFLDEATAASRLAEVKAALKLDGQVLSQEGMFKVVLGNFKTKAAANAKAGALLGKPGVDMATVVPLKK